MTKRRIAMSVSAFKPIQVTDFPQVPLPVFIMSIMRMKFLIIRFPIHLEHELLLNACYVLGTMLRITE